MPSAQRPETLQSSRKAVPHSVEDNGHDKASSSASNFAKDSLPKKKRKVSWASEEKLVDVHFIDTRLELVRSWDPESQITLPFAPGTLHLFQSALREMESPKHGGAQSGKYHQDGSMEEVCAMPKVTSFEEARKKEHDMELERAQQAREELKGWLDAMTAEHSWRMPMAIVLPTECRMDKSTLEPYSIVSVDYVSTPPDSNHLLKSPASPPLHSHAPYERIGNGSRNIPLIPLSDNVGENGGGDGFEKSDGVGADGKEYSHRPNREAFYGGHQEQSRVHGSSMTGFRSHARSVGPAACNSRDTSNTMHDSMEHTSRPSSSSGHTRHHRNQQTEFNESSVPPIPRPSVQHILSLLQTSGLLKSGNGLMHTPMKGVEYSRHANEHHSREDGYRTQHDAHGRPVEGMEGYGDVDGRDGHNEMSVAAGGSNVSGGNGQIGPPPSMLGHSGAGYGQNVQQAGLMDVMPFPMPPIPPPPLGMPPSMLPLGLGIPMGMPLGMGMPLPVPPSAIAMNGSGQGLGGKSGGGGSGGRSSIGGGRGVETISRPKPKPAKQRKRCKYFGTKQGCRDGNSCMFAHN